MFLLPRLWDQRPPCACPHIKRMFFLKHLRLCLALSEMHHYNCLAPEIHICEKNTTVSRETWEPPEGQCWPPELTGVKREYEIEIVFLDVKCSSSTSRKIKKEKHHPQTNISSINIIRYHNFTDRYIKT